MLFRSRMPPDSWQFAVLRAWVEAGTPWKAGSGAVTGLTLNVSDFVIIPTKANKQLRVIVVGISGWKPR